MDSVTHMNDYLKEIQSKGFMHLKDVDFNFGPSLLTQIYKFFNEVRTFPEKYFKHYRGHLYIMNEPVNSLEEFNKIIDKFELRKEEDDFYWFQIFRQCDIPESKKIIFLNYIRHIINTIYGVSVTHDKIVSNLTCFTKGCGIVPHKDNNDNKRICGILSYFSEDWDESNGGLLKLNNNQTFNPTLGNIVILDYTKNNIEHEVTEVLKENKYRLALTTFVHK